MSSEAINSFADTTFQEICTGDTALYTCRVATSKILIVPCHIITQNSNLRYNAYHSSFVSSCNCSLNSNWFQIYKVTHSYTQHLFLFAIVASMQSVYCLGCKLETTMNTRTCRQCQHMHYQYSGKLNAINHKEVVGSSINHEPERYAVLHIFLFSLSTKLKHCPLLNKNVESC